MSDTEQGLSLEEAVTSLMAPEPQDTPEPEVEDAEIAEETDEAPDPEADNPDAEDDDDGDDDGQEEGDDDDPTFSLELDGGTREVALSELKSGYLRQADYTRKTQEVAADRKATEAEMARARELQQHLQGALAEWAVAGSEEPDWVQLAQTMEPKDFQVAQVVWQQKQQRRQQAQHYYNQLRAAEHAQRNNAEKERLLKAIPEWADKDRLIADVREMVPIAENYGFTEADVMGFTDARQIQALRDLVAYHKGKGAAEKKVAQADKTMRPGAKPNRKKSSAEARNKQRARLKQTGSIDDALALLMDG